MAEEDRPAANCRYVLLDGGPLPFPDGHFDCVTAIVVLQHVVADEMFAALCREIARVTRPGGTVVVLDGVGCRANHARSRTPEEVGEALGMDWASFMHDGGGTGDFCGIGWGPSTVDAEHEGSHWCASFEKGGA